METVYQPYCVDPQLELLIERIYPPRFVSKQQHIKFSALFILFGLIPLGIGVFFSIFQSLHRQWHLSGLHPSQGSVPIFELHAFNFMIFCWLRVWIFIWQVDSANKHGILLEMVQVLTDLDLVISKSYISSDGGWFMDGPFPHTSYLFNF